MHERYTDRSRRVFALASQEAQRVNHTHIGPQHVLLGLIKEGSGVGSTILSDRGVTLEGARAEVLKRFPAGTEMVPMGRLPVNDETKALQEAAENEARSMRHNYVGTEHLLVALATTASPQMVEILEALGQKPAELVKDVWELLGVDGRHDSPAPTTAMIAGAMSMRWLAGQSDDGFLVAIARSGMIKAALGGLD